MLGVQSAAKQLRRFWPALRPRRLDRTREARSREASYKYGTFYMNKWYEICGRLGLCAPRLPNWRGTSSLDELANEARTSGMQKSKRPKMHNLHNLHNACGQESGASV